MKLKYFILIFILLTVLYGLTDTPVPLQVWRTNGVVASPTNFWYSNVIAGANIELTPTRSNITIAVTGVVTAASSSLTNALLHAGPTNGSVGALVLTAGNGVTLTTSGTNREISLSTNILIGSSLWTNFSVADVEGGYVRGLRDSNGVARVASFGVNFLTNFWGSASSIITLGYPAGSESDGVSSVSILNIGDFSGNNQVLTNTSDVFNLGYATGSSQRLTNCDVIVNLGSYVGISQKLTACLYIWNSGWQAGQEQRLTNTWHVYNLFDSAGHSGTALNSWDIASVGFWAGYSRSLNFCTNIYSFGYYSGAFATASNAHSIYNFGYKAGGTEVIGDASHYTNSKSVFNYGYGAGQKQVLQESTNIYNYGTYSGSNQVSSGANRVYAYGAYSGAISAITNSSDIYGFGTYSFRDAHINDSTNLFGVGIDTFEHALLTNSHNITAIGFETLENAKLTNSIDIIAIGNRVGLSGDGLTDIIILANDVSSALSHQVVLGAADQTNLIQGSLQITSGTPGAGKVLTDVNGDGFATWQTAGGGSGIATNEGTGFKTTFYGQTNFGNITFTNGARIEQPTATITRFTNTTFDFGGNMTFTPDNTYGIGGGTRRPSTLDVAGTITAGSHITTFASFLLGNNGGLTTIADGSAYLRNNAATDWGRLAFGGSTAAFPALKRNAGHLAVVDAAGSNSTNSLFFGNTVDTTASTGMTMNRQTGRVRLSAGNQTYLVTNNLATANSIVTATVNSDDANALSVKAIPAAGLITLKVNAATAADTDISFFISSP